MLKKLAIFGGVLIVLLMITLTYITVKYQDKEEILRVTQEREKLKEQRTELLAKVAKADSTKQVYEAKVSEMEREAQEMRAKVDSLENSREVAQANVRKLRTESALENELMEAFPAIKTSMKMIEVPVENFPNIKLHYFSVPFRFAETFLIDHQNSQNYEKQRDKLKDLDRMNTQITDLQKKVVLLEEEKSAAYKQGYDSAYVKYQEINEKYLALLREPPSVKFGLPQVGAVALGTAAGFVGGVALGTAIK